MTNRFNNGQFDDNAGTDPIDSLLSQAMSSRDHQLRSSPGSLQDVRMRARRITRRRAAVGAGALAAVGAVGAVAVATRGNDGNGPRIVAGEGGTADGDARFGLDGGYWQCTGQLSGVVIGYNELLGLGEVVASPAPTGYEQPDSTTSLYAVGPTTTVPDGFITGTVVSNTTPPDLTTTSVEYDESQYSTTSTIDPSVATSTTVDVSATTSTLPVMGSTTTDPGFATATSALPSPYPMSPVDDGVYYMRDCVHVDVAPDQTGPSETTNTEPEAAGPSPADSEYPGETVPGIEPAVESLPDVIDSAPTTLSDATATDEASTTTTVAPTATSTTIDVPASTSG